jgi:signal transduction histidine kinase/DNA-binding response OmpR family regulator
VPEQGEGVEVVQGGSMKGSAPLAPDDWLVGGGEMASVIKAMDWSLSLLGPIAAWPQSLRTIVSLTQASNSPMSVIWGPGHVQIYNGGYRPICGAKHPRSMGQDFRECWASAFPEIGEAYESAWAGKGAYLEKVRMFLDRYGFVEETWFTFAFSPVTDESGRIGGVFHPVTEMTSQMLSERRTRTLKDIASRAGRAETSDQALALTTTVLAEAHLDLPFVLLFLIDEVSGQPRLMGHTGLSAAPLDLLGQQHLSAIAEVARTGLSSQFDDVAEQLAGTSVGPYPEQPRTARLLPLMLPGRDVPAGVLVMGSSARLKMDESYRGFCALVATGVAAGLANAIAFEGAQKRAEALAEIDRVKTRFFANVSHEFRTPLALLLAPLSEALTTGSRTLGGEDLEMAHRNAQRLLKLVNTLLDFSRVDPSRTGAYRPTDLSALTVDLASAFRSAVERVGITFAVDCPHLPHEVFVDHDMWEKIVLNLLSNALKFTFQGTISVTMGWNEAGPTLVVGDSGTGIAAAELPHMFERFHRIEGARSRTHEGSGIGLALVHELVRLHGGSISVTSALDVGTRFTIALPWGSQHLAAKQIASRSTPPRPPGSNATLYVEEAAQWETGDAEVALRVAGPPIPSPLYPTPGGALTARVLLADDNRDMRDYLARLLRREQWKVDVVADGNAALEAALASPPDVVLTDVMMPKRDGFQLLHALRADPRTREVPVILLSARADSGARIEGLEAGAADYIVKPFGARELIARVQLQITNKQMRAALEAQRAELYSAFMQAPVPICVLRGPDLVFEMANALYCKFVGREASAVLGRPLLDAIPEVRGQGFDVLLREVIATGVAKVIDETLIPLDLKGDGALEDTYWSSSYSPLREPDDHIERVLCVLNHTTDQVRVRKDLERQRELAKSATRAKDEFLAMLGHELRNPLAPILTALQLLHLRGEKTKESSIIERQVKHLVRLVDDLFDVARIARGQIVLKRELLDLADVVAAALEIATPLVEECRHTLTVDVPHHSLMVHGDRIRLAQVVSNLLTNAAKYTESGGTLAIAASRRQEWVELRVRDSGIGIAPSMVPRVFDLFSQEQQGIDRAQGGLGLGLAIVRNIVQLHGGDVAVHSEGLAKGSEFLVRLPLATAEVTVASPAPTAEPVTAKQQSLRVMLVDDNADAAEMLGTALELSGYTVRTAPDGPSALKLASEVALDVAILDIGLPGMDGYDLARRLRANPEHADLRLVALTGYGQAADLKRAREAGFDEHVVKPVDLVRLDAAIRGESQAKPSA